MNEDEPVVLLSVPLAIYFHSSSNDLLVITTTGRIGGLLTSPSLAICTFLSLALLLSLDYAINQLQRI